MADWQAVNSHSNTPYDALTTDFREVPGRTSVIAFFLGTAIIVASIFLGRSYVFFVSFLAFSIVMTLLWTHAPRPWIFLVSISAATPIAVSKQQFACNLIFALWFTVFNMRYLFRLPKWIYVPTALAVLGIFGSSINWISGDALRDPVRMMMRQGAFAYNFFLAPFLLLPVVYLRMRESRNHAADLQGLLFCLIVPSTLILISAKLFGTVANAWEASLHSESIPDGFLQYQVGKVVVNFLRTEVGFIFAALACASAAIAFSQVKALYRLLAGACLASNTYLLIGAGSFGSGFACLCGLAGIFYAQARAVNLMRVFVSVTTIACILLLAYGFSPPRVKEYLTQRYEHRVAKSAMDQDRFMLWRFAVEHLIEHPEGVGLTLSVGDKQKTFTHNDYLTYAVSYGLIGGLAYASLVAGLLIAFFRRRRSTMNDPSLLAIHLAGLGVTLALAVNSMTDHMNSNRWYFNVMWSLIWYSYFCGRAAQIKAPGGDKTRNRHFGNF